MVGSKLNSNNVVLIYSTIELVNGNSAGSARVMNYARALSSSCDVVLLTFLRLKNISLKNLIEIEPGIYTVGYIINSNKIVSKLFYCIRIFYFLKSIVSLLEEFGNLKNKTLLFYPSTKVFIDYMTLVYLIKYKKFRIIYEANEIRKYSADFEINSFNFNLKLQKLMYGQSEKLTKYFSGLICISTNIEKYFKKFNSNTIRIPILSNLNIKEYKEIIYQKNEIFRIGFFGSVSICKENLLLFLRSLAELKEIKPNLKFIVEFYGPIDLETNNKLPKLILNLGLHNIVFYKGQVKQINVISLMRNFHLLVLPRGANLQNHYGFSTKLSEYLVSGTPCLVTNVSDNALYINDNDNGFIVEPDNLKAFSNKLIFIIENYNSFHKKMVKSSFMTVEKHFQYTNYSNILSQFICSME